jgi:hypothetical protein
MTTHVNDPLKAAWLSLQEVPSYVESRARAFANEPTPTLVREDDVTAHIEDTLLFWVPRDGSPVQLTWNEMTEDERLAQREADRRAAYVVQFDPCSFA